MKQKTKKPVLHLVNGGNNQDSLSSYQSLINKHFELIERQCFNAVRRQLEHHGALNNPLNIENETLELSNRVLDILKRDNYRVLRQFKGKAKLSTYITTIIARQAVDMIRKKLGRNREKERAQKFGETGLLIYEKVIVQGLAVNDFYPDLNKPGHSISQEEVEVIVEKIKGKKSRLSNLPANNSVVREGVSVNENGDYIIPDTEGDPQEILLKKQKEHKLQEIIKNTITQLNGEEKVILRMRFPTENEEKMGKIEHIADLLGISEKAVYKRIAKILRKCRELIKQQGVSIDDLL